MWLPWATMTTPKLRAHSDDLLNNFYCKKIIYENNIIDCET